VRVQADVPSKQDVLTWKPNLVVILEGLFLSVPLRSAYANTHYYNMVNLVVPSLLRYVRDPLEGAGALKGTRVHLHQERLRAEGCAAPVKQRDGASPKPTSLLHLRSACQSGLALLPTMIPDLAVDFVDWLPRCQHFDTCEVGTAQVPNATVLVLPRVWTLGAAKIPPKEVARVQANLAALRRYYLSPRPPARATQVTLVVRGPEAGHASSTYSYERSKVNVQNMPDLEPVASEAAAARGLPFQAVLLEELPFHEQIAVMRKTAVLIGTEGAGLANMAFLEEPFAEKRVLEINWPGGKIKDDEEFPTMGRTLGVKVTMLLANEARVVDKVAFRKKLEDILDEVGVDMPDASNTTS
jgi:hypothetical protein